MTAKQKIIYQFVKEQGEPVKKQVIVQRFKRWYYCNSSKHLGDLMSRMVKKGWLKRSKIGYYECGSGIPPIEVDKNQIDLF